jgi:predicted RNA-binding protein with RPS1 domain
VGDDVTAKVVSVSTADHKIGLSVKRKTKDEEEGTYKEYLTDNGKPVGTNGTTAPSFGAAFGNLDKLLAEKKQSNDEAGN